MVQFCKTCSVSVHKSTQSKELDMIQLSVRFYSLYNKFYHIEKEIDIDCKLYVATVTLTLLLTLLRCNDEATS